MARLGVMGGTFDPVHNGHLVCASEVAYRLSLDEVVFLPTGRPWQKDEVSDAEHRYAMTLLATRDDDRFTTSRAEVDRSGPTYTVDTLRALKAERPGDEVFFIVGSDTLAQLRTWREPDELLRLATFVAVERPGFGLSPMPGVQAVDIPGVRISSTECRERVRVGAPIRYLVPDPVVDYIEEHQLYGSPRC